MIDAHELHDNGAENYPQRLRLTVGSADDAFERILEDVDEPAEEAVRTFARPGDLRQLLTDRRVEVMRSIMAEPPASISALADRLERNYADVHADVELLAEHRIVYFDTHGQAKRPVIPYETIEFDVTIRAGVCENDADDAPASAD